MHPWPKHPIRIPYTNTTIISIVFTWHLPPIALEAAANPRHHYIVGGPATQLLPDYFSHLPNVTRLPHHTTMLQRINPFATFTTRGCPNHCPFCAVPRIEGPLRELSSWPVRPIICDNNLLAASESHFERVITSVIPFGYADFNQGLDARLLTLDHAKQLKRIKKPTIRLALDSLTTLPQWELAYSRLRSAGIAKHNIRSYALIAFNSDPQEAWTRCLSIEKHGIKALPMWFHELDALTKNSVTAKQVALGWTPADRTRIMGFFYRHRGSIPEFASR